MSRGNLEVWVRVPAEADARAAMRRLVNVIAVVAIADVLLLGPLVWAAIADRESLVSVLGPIHGFGFIALLSLVVRGVMTDRWGWWWPMLVLITLGPIGSLIGDLAVRREIDAATK